MNQLTAPLTPKIGRKLFLLVALGFAALIAGAAAAAWLQRANQQQTDAVERSLQVQSAAGEFATLVERVETARRGYMLSSDEAYLEIFKTAEAPMPGLLVRIQGLVRDDAEQQRRAGSITALLSRQRAYQQQTITAVSAGRRVEVVQRFAADPAVPLTRAIRALANEMIDTERRGLAARTAEQQRTLQIFYAVLAVVGMLIIAVAATTMVIMRRYTSELTSSRDELSRLNNDLEGLVTERTADLQRANQEIQRFAYIVSHDLRSPLVNVMGFTAELETARKHSERLLARLEETAPELLDNEARIALREDLPEAIGFIRASTQKMDRLINAILRLSREGRRTLATEPLDLDEMVQGIIDSLHQRTVQVGAEIEAAPLPRIDSDRVAMEQILSNLIENAVKYLAPGRPGLVKVTGWEEGDSVILEIEDNGRGIDPRDHERIFDLFRRSGVQDQAGEGIGLAHVRALAYRLGGVIGVRSELDRGATFRLSLPRTFETGVAGND
jgi:signal transduction histidine kinase